MAKAKKKFYVVWKGRKAGVYQTWAECKAQIEGYQEAKYKSFPTRAAAEAAYKQPFDMHIGQKKPRTPPKSGEGSPIWKSLSVDAACSGNPGVLEYQGVDTASGKCIFHKGPFPQGTVNIGEFLALVHGLAYLKKQNIDVPIYSDSRTAIAWVRRKAANTKLARSPKNAPLFELIERAEHWLKTNEYSTEILKWDTKHWGEIPADFGRK